MKICVGDLLGGGPRELSVQLVDLDEACDVGVGVAPAECVQRRSTPVVQPARGEPLRHQARQLRSRKAGHFAHQREHSAFVPTAQGEVVELSERVSDPLAAFVAGRRYEPDWDRPVEKGPDVVQGSEQAGVEGHDHPPRMTVQAHLSLESPDPFQAHVSLEEARACADA